MRLNSESHHRGNRWLALAPFVVAGAFSMWGDTSKAYAAPDHTGRILIAQSDDGPPELDSVRHGNKGANDSSGASYGSRPFRRPADNGGSSAGASDSSGGGGKLNGGQSTGPLPEVRGQRLFGGGEGLGQGRFNGQRFQDLPPRMQKRLRERMLNGGRGFPRQFGQGQGVPAQRPFGQVSGQQEQDSNGPQQSFGQGPNGAGQRSLGQSASAAASGAGQRPFGTGSGPGQGAGKPQVGGGLFGSKQPLDFSSLNLSDDQKNRIREIRKQNAGPVKDLQRTLKETRLSMRDMMFDPQATDDQIRSKVRAVHDMQNRMEEMQINDFLSIRKVLNPDQRQRLPSIKPVAAGPAQVASDDSQR